MHTPFENIVDYTVAAAAGRLTAGQCCFVAECIVALLAESGFVDCVLDQSRLEELTSKLSCFPTVVESVHFLVEPIHNVGPKESAGNLDLQPHPVSHLQHGHTFCEKKNTKKICRQFVTSSPESGALIARVMASMPELLLRTPSTTVPSIGTGPGGGGTPPPTRIGSIEWGAPRSTG